MIGLALSGGAGLGWAHIGVIRALQEENIPIGAVAGTSIGAIVGAGVALDRLDLVEETARALSFRSMLRMGEFTFRTGGLIGTNKIEQELRRHFGDVLIEDLPIPYAAVAADMISGDRVILDGGDLVMALRASSAIPGVFPPVTTSRMLLADGGMVDPVPVAVARSLGAAHVVAVDLQGDYIGRAQRMGLEAEGLGTRMPGPLKMARAALFMTMRTLGRVRMAHEGADVVITPKIGHVDVADFTKADELIALGRLAGRQAIPEILDILEREPAPVMESAG
ncbi:patatin-like phospholipase family protein [Pseudokordiimonas caeni]|uniref:patatin-like phospholipase family protein n=1 Tax=Pseudokordiimonas caeni TaxID=2997908 RepID=UPI002812411F|nr:patatin-like phospholipase family protein [Pseudokordiimonas caeni]